MYFQESLNHKKSRTHRTRMPQHRTPTPHPQTHMPHPLTRTLQRPHQWSSRRRRCWTQAPQCQTLTILIFPGIRPRSPGAKRGLLRRSRLCPRRPNIKSTFMRRHRKFRASTSLMTSPLLMCRHRLFILLRRKSISKICLGSRTRTRRMTILLISWAITPRKLKLRRLMTSSMILTFDCFYFTPFYYLTYFSNIFIQDQKNGL